MTKDNTQSACPAARRPISSVLARARFLPGIILALLLLGSIAVRVSAQVPTAVELLYFQGESEGNTAYLEWETGTEQDTAGFRLERAPSAAGPYTPLEGYEFIVATGSVANGARYEATDETVVGGQTYWYKLVEVSNANTDVDEWTVSVEIMGAEPTAQVIVGGGSTATATSTLAATGTSEPTATGRSATNTPVASGNGSDDSRNATSTPAPTNTPRPTNTAQPPSAPTQAIATRIARATAPSSAVTEGEETGAPTASPTVDADPLGGENSLATAPATPVLAEDAAAVAEAAAVETQAGVAEVTDDGEETSLLDIRSVGSRAEADVTAAENATAQQEGESSRLLLWLGFVAAFLIFVGGVAFSIFLSTRKRSDDS